MRNFTFLFKSCFVFTIFLVSQIGFAQTQIDFEDFDSGSWATWIWNDGGSDCATENPSPINGTRALRIRDNTTTSTVTTNDLDFTPYSSVTISFIYQGVSMENNEDFWLRYSDDGGGSWTTIETYVSGTDFSNGTNESVLVTLNSGPYVFTSNSQFQFRCDASGNADFIYIDDVEILGYGATAPANDLCADATALPCGTTNLAGSTVNASNIAHGTGCTWSDYGVWYTFTGDGNQTTIDVDADAGYDHAIAIASGSCGGLTNIACEDSWTAGGVESYTFNTVNGTDYYIYVAYWGSGSTTGGFTISRTCTTNSCIPVFTMNVEPITNVNFNGINNTTSEVVNATLALEDFTPTISTSVIQGSNHIITVEGNTDGNFTNYFRVFFDWNQDGDFIDANETAAIGSITNSTGIDGQQASTLVNVPFGAAPGSTVMRVMKAYGGDPIDPCSTTYTYGQAEDYTINVTAATPCSEPTTQPTILDLNVIGSTITGSFVAASPNPDSYLVVYNTTNVTPSPSDGIGYAIGETFGAGNTVADIDGDTNFSVTGLAGLTTYYFFVFSNNNSSCSPNYLLTSPLTNNATTTISYCSPSVSTDTYAASSYIKRIDFVGTLNNTTNTSTYSTGALRGFQDFTGLSNISQQSQGEGVNVYNEFEITANPVHVKAWVDWNQDGDFDDAGEDVYDTTNQSILSSTFGFVISDTQTIGFYRLRIRASESSGGFSFNSCIQTTYYGETEDYLFEVLPKCTNIITEVYDGVACGPNQNVVLEFEGTSGVTTGFNVYTNETGGSPLSPAPSFTGGATPTGTWSTPSISTTTSYWVTATNSCESLKRTEIIANIKPIPTLSFTPNTPVLCGEDNIVEIAASGDKETVYLIDEDFEGSANSGLNSFTSFQYSSGPSSNPDPITDTEWTQRASTYIPEELVWFPAIASDFGTNKYVLTNSDINAVDASSNPIPFQNELRSATINSTDFLNLTLSFYMYYSDYYESDTALNPSGDYFSVRVSTDGGSNWTTERLDYNADVGVGTGFDRLSLDLSSYINEEQLVISFYYYSNFWADGVALDNIKLFGEKPLSSDFDWIVSADVYTDPAATVPYTLGSSAPLSTIYVKPTPTQLENTTFTFTATAILSNGCDASTDISINNNTKYFKGPDNSYIEWNDANNWKPLGVPSSDNCVIIPDTYNCYIDGNTDGDARNVTVKNGGELYIEPNGTLTIVNFSDIRSGGIFDIENGGSLIQIDNVLNTGEGNVKRNSSNVRDSDYIYWSSPVDAYDISGISPSIPSYYKWQWLPTVVSNTNGYGDWANATGNMTLGKGYIVRAGTSNSDSTADTPVNTTFNGVFNNGDIALPISCGTYNAGDYSGPSSTTVTKNDDNWNLIGNPYPSAINAIDFLAANSNIEGAVHIWTHGTQLNDTNLPPFYEDYEFSYNVNDYLTYNSSGASSGAGTFGGNITSGQGFFVLMNHGEADTDVNFNNTMRNKLYSNSEFYRTLPVENTNNLERHRIWLSIISPTNQTATSLVGYIEGATLAKDRMYDAYGLERNAMNMYSLIEEEPMIIQGRPLPFDSEDRVPLGAVIPVNGNYTITIHSLDGLFENESQAIYLEDLELNIIHNLRVQPYSFNAESGTINNRFILRYTTESLGVDEFNHSNLEIMAPNNAYIKVNSGNSAISSVTLYDLLGSILVDKKEINNSEFTMQTSNYADGAYIVKAVSIDGKQKIQKVVLRH